MKHTIYILILGILFFCTPLRAQEKNKPFQHLSLSLGVGIMGAGLQLTAPLHPHLALRAGFDALPLDISFNYYEGEYEIATNSTVKFLNGNVLADWYPMRNGLFHVTGGVFLGESSAKGVARSARSYTLNGHTFEPEYFGTAHVTVKTAFAKPYLGIGLGRAIPRSRWAFRTELGVMYHGTPQVEVVNNTVFLLSIGDLPELREEVVKYKFYPQLSFKVAYRLF